MATIAGSRVLNEDRPLRWRSWLGLGVAFFLIAALVNVIAAVFVPLLLHRQGAAAVGSSLVSLSDLGYPEAPRIIDRNQLRGSPKRPSNPRISLASIGIGQFCNRCRAADL